jgi:hypothetical protein
MKTKRLELKYLELHKKFDPENILAATLELMEIFSLRSGHLPPVATARR